LGYDGLIPPNEVYVTIESPYQHDLRDHDMILTTKREMNPKKRDKWLYKYDVVV